MIPFSRREAGRPTAASVPTISKPRLRRRPVRRRCAPGAGTCAALTAAVDAGDGDEWDGEQRLDAVRVRQLKAGWRRRFVPRRSLAPTVVRRSSRQSLHVSALHDHEKGKLVARLCALRLTSCGLVLRTRRHDHSIGELCDRLPSTLVAVASDLVSGSTDTTPMDVADPAHNGLFVCAANRAGYWRPRSVRGDHSLSSSRTAVLTTW